MKPTTTFEFEANLQNQKNAGEGSDNPDGGTWVVLQPSRIVYIVMISTAFWAFVLYYYMQNGDGGVASVLFKPSAFSLPLLPSITGAQSPRPVQPEQKHAGPGQAPPPPVLADRCHGRYVYMYDLPPRFNDDLVRNCRNLQIWMDMCPYVVNCGMGPAMGDEGGAFSGRGWFATDQFSLDIIFHGRMKRYDCLTDDPSRAAAVYVPFYASLDGGRYQWNSTSIRDALGLDLVDWLARRPEWRAMGGRDHFLVAGRTAVDFGRNSDLDHEWGTKLLNFPAVENMTALVLETNQWKPKKRRNLAVPYPTYFHPESAADVVAWQEKVRNTERNWLFSFAGGPRPGNTETVRADIIQQCAASTRCRLFHCGAGPDAGANCSSPGGVMRVFESSVFCLQPRGDTLTRRSTFDTMLAGCIPVFFHPGSAYRQYTAHLPKDPNSYSVLIMHTDVTGRNVSIEDTLSNISPAAVKAMREEVIRLIPRLVYADPRSRRVDFTDAFDLATEAVINRVAKRRRGR
ncbi:putative xyloglucan galactosyltransferase GT15 [Zea mays]|jgi:xyloglucan galactosyltransferase MUR3|uniref:Putative xyloglucan galactosyltransferase GT15 n=1 Tax=Zea mays TaxID=4577 RepID=A0A1D6KU05_MAIZE|nr:putative xyloglucan galactosyltransferase GT15 [Zea mays]